VIEVVVDVGGNISTEGIGRAEAWEDINLREEEQGPRKVTESLLEEEEEAAVLTSGGSPEPEEDWEKDMIDISWREGPKTGKQEEEEEEGGSRVDKTAREEEGRLESLNSIAIGKGKKEEHSTKKLDNFNNWLGKNKGRKWLKNKNKKIA